MIENYFELDSNKIWYGIEGDISNKTPLIVLHGGPGAPHNYLVTLSELADETPIIYYDQLNCGKSDRNLDHKYMTMQYLVYELESLIEYLNIEKFHLIGQSFGGTLALEYLLEKGISKCKSVVFASAALSAKRFAEDARKGLKDISLENQKIINECEEKGDYSNPNYAKAIDEYSSKHLIRNNSIPELMNETMNSFGAEIYNYMWGPSEFTCTGTLKDYDRISELGKLMFLPVLFTCGKYDELSSETIFHYQSFLPNSRSVIFGNSAHIANIEEKELFNKIMRSFIGSAE